MRSRGGPGRVARVLALLLLALIAGVSFERARTNAFDFSHLHHDARTVWERRALDAHIDPRGADEGRRLPFYLPSVPVLLAPLAAGDRPVTAGAWAAIQVLSAAASMHVLAGWLAGAPPWAPTFAMLLMAPAIVEAAKFNQFSFPVLALALLGFQALARGRTALGGAALGAAAVVKLLPAMLIVWLACKRRGRSLAGAAVAIVALIAGPSLAAFGPQRAWSYHVEWARFTIGGDAAGGLVNAARREHFIDHRNQSIPQVVARWTWAGSPHGMPRPFAAWSESTARRAGAAITVALAATLVALTRRPWSALSDHSRRAEFAAWCLAMAAFSPLLRQYYLVWAAPAAVLCIAAAANGPGRWAARAAVVVWVAGMAAWLSPICRLGGAHLLMLLAMIALLLATSRGRAADRAAAG